MTVAALIMKEFMHPDGANRVLKLANIYRLLENKLVPNVDAWMRTPWGRHTRLL
jgi:hypothetical protein